MKSLAVFASGTGSNALSIATYFKNHSSIEVKLIVSNKPNAPVLGKAKELGISTLVINRKMFYENNELLQHLKKENIDFIVLAGFLWLMPSSIIEMYPNKIVNIHPSLLPKYGGKGMYGMNVHQAVSESGDEKSGMTIHFVNSKYDEGKIIYQASVSIIPHTSAKEIAAKVLKLEHEFYPKIIENILNQES